MAVQRQTQQRDVIWSVLEKAKRPLDADEIFERGKSRLPRLGIATVYRAIRSMMETHDIVPVHVPDRPTCYEVAGRGHHHHFYCRECRKVFEAEGCPGGMQEMAPEGFTIEFHEITLHGLCADCKH